MALEQEIPQWVYWIGGGVGTAFTTFAIHMGWKSGGEKKGGSDKTLVLDGALVDSSSIRMLTAAIEAGTLELITGRHDAEKARQAGYRMIETVAKLGDEVEELRRVVQDMSNQIARSR